MTDLIITEKFSVASDFAKALGVNKKSDGYFRNEQTIITWAVGHLVELYEPEDYNPELKKWRIQTLPVIPDRFRYKPIGKTYHQLKIIKSLLGDKSIKRVIIATDAGREGEVIARTILLESGFTDKERIFRFWTSQALVPDVVKKSMGELKKISEYDRIWRAGYYRQVADWLVGMNCTRMVTLRLGGELFSVGRVQTAVLALVVDRKHKRESFVPEIYWIIKVFFSNEKGKWTGYWFRCGQSGNISDTGIEGTGGSSSQEKHDLKTVHTVRNKKEADNICKAVRESGQGVVQSVVKEKKKEPPPLLFSLTDLQQEANRRFGFSAQKTLTIAQSLYQDRKCLSYPRTDSRVLGTSNVDMVENIIKKLGSAYEKLFRGVDPARISLSNKRVFDDAKLTDHHALIPFKPIQSDANSDEHRIFDLVMTRFAAAFHPDCQFENTCVVTATGGETFQTNGRVILVPGWKDVYQDQTAPAKHKSGARKAEFSVADSCEADHPDESRPGIQELVQHIPPLARGDNAIADKVLTEEKKTTPPPDYTDSLLLKDMTNPGKYVDEEEIKKLYRGDTGIGTQATRAQIIETLVKRKYIERSGKKLAATDKGVFLVRMLRKCPVTSVLTSPEETARWEMSLNSIALGEAPAASGFPVSGRELNHTASFLERIKHFVSDAVNELKLARLDCISTPQTSLESSGKSGKPDPLKSPENPKNLVCGKQSISALQPDFHESPESCPQSATHRHSDSCDAVCPLCGGNIIEGKKGYGCSNWRPENGSCRFVIWKEIMGRHLTYANIKTLVSGKPTILYSLKDRHGKKFRARLKMFRNMDMTAMDMKNTGSDTAQNSTFLNHSTPCIIRILPEQEDFIMQDQDFMVCSR